MACLPPSTTDGHDPINSASPCCLPRCFPRYPGQIRLPHHLLHPLHRPLCWGPQRVPHHLLQPPSAPSTLSCVQSAQIHSPGSTSRRASSNLMLGNSQLPSGPPGRAWPVRHHHLWHVVLRGSTPSFSLRPGQHPPRALRSPSIDGGGAGRSSALPCRCSSPPLFLTPYRDGHVQAFNTSTCCARRRPGPTDTASVVIFKPQRDTRYGYASALAILLLLIILALRGQQPPGK